MLKFLDTDLGIEDLYYEILNYQSNLGLRVGVDKSVSNLLNLCSRDNFLRKWLQNLGWARSLRFLINSRFSGVQRVYCWGWICTEDCSKGAEDSKHVQILGDWDGGSSLSLNYGSLTADLMKRHRAGVVLTNVSLDVLDFLHNCHGISHEQSEASSPLLGGGVSWSVWLLKEDFDD
jgi:hypothetical protein